MSINAEKVFIKCPNCNHIYVGYDYHENTSSDRCETFCVLNRGNAHPNATMYIGPNSSLQQEFICEECKSGYTYDYLFKFGFCSVEDKGYYKRVLQNGLLRFSQGSFISFSDWDHDFQSEATVTEQPALERLCMMYPEDEDFKRYAEIYQMCRAVGRDYLNKLETGASVVCRQQVIMPPCLRKVYLNNGVRSIGERAFMDCRSLWDIFLPDSVTKICTEAFRNSGLRSIRISDCIRSIGDRAFAGCASLEKIFLPKNLKRIGESCFEDCRKLSHLWIPEGIEIGIGAFKGCKSLSRIELPVSMKDKDISYWGLPENTSFSIYTA